MSVAFIIQFFLGIGWCICWIWMYDAGSNSTSMSIMQMAFLVYQTIFILQGLILNRFFKIRDWRLTIAAMIVFIFNLFSDKATFHFFAGLTVISISCVIAASKASRGQH